MGQTWTFDFGVASNNLSAPLWSSDLSSAPQDNMESRDSGWLLKASYVHPEEKPQPIAEGRASVIVELETGVFETCVLVGNAANQACQVKFGSADTRVAAAEAMVLRQEIPLSATVKIRGTSPDLTIKETSNESQVQNETVKGYGKVYNIAILNVPQVGGRAMSTHHTKALKAMFLDPKGSWDKATASVCTLPVQRQPDCFDYFSKFVPRFSGYNRPICPLVEGP